MLNEMDSAARVLSLPDPIQALGVRVPVIPFGHVSDSSVLYLQVESADDASQLAASLKQRFGAGGQAVQPLAGWDWGQPPEYPLNHLSP